MALFATRLRDAKEELNALAGYQRPKDHWARHPILQRLYALPVFAVGIYLLATG